VRLIRQLLGNDVISRRTTKDDQVEQRVRSQSVCAMDRYTGAFADGIQAGNNGVWIATLWSNNLPVDIGGNAPHLIVNRWHDRDGLFDWIHVGELDCNLSDRGQLLQNLVGPEVIELEKHMVFIGATASSFLNFLVH